MVGEAEKMVGQSSTKNPSPLDLVIAGGGYVGLTIAVAIKTAAPHLRILIVETTSVEHWKKESRSSAIAAAAVRMLNYLDCWHSILPNAQPINEMIITDSRTIDPVRPIFLTFEGKIGPDEPPDEPFAYMVENSVLNETLHKKASELGIEMIHGMSVTHFETHAATVTVHLKNTSSLEARLLIAADGISSKLRDQANIRTLCWDYDQSAIVCTVCHERPHHGRAEEHFLPAGPFAILPLIGNRSSLVWTERTADAERLMKGDDLPFKRELERRFGHKLGELKVEGARKAFPLRLMLAREFIRPRFALAGDAAHGIHPIAGQGLNLGFRDAAALAEVIVETDRLGLDIGTLTALERYQIWRRFDTVQLGIVTDILNRLFSNDRTPVRAIRDIGLGLVDRIPSMKRFFIRQAAGLSPNIPRLLQGEEI